MRYGNLCSKEYGSGVYTRYLQMVWDLVSKIDSNCKFLMNGQQIDSISIIKSGLALSKHVTHEIDGLQEIAKHSVSMSSSPRSRTSTSKSCPGILTQNPNIDIHVPRPNSIPLPVHHEKRTRRRRNLRVKTPHHGFEEAR
jgi:hypothetical protein